jgi:hypothetical protein
MSRNKMKYEDSWIFYNLVFSCSNYVALNEMANNDGIVRIWKGAVMPYFRL